MSAQKYRKLPVEIEAWEMASPQETEPLFAWCPNLRFNFHGYMVLETADHDVPVNGGDYIVRDEYGDYSVAHPKRFAKTYEEVTA